MDKASTYRAYNLHLCDGRDCDWYGWPVVLRSRALPSHLADFDTKRTRDSPDRYRDAYCHFYVDDYKFERLWNCPERYVGALGRYEGAIAPDFSTYTDMPEPMQRWNVYRSRALAAYYRRVGIDVIPLLQWSDERSHEWCFDGLPKGGTYALPATMGFSKDPEALRLYRLGLSEALRRVEPDVVVLYGPKIDIDVSGPLVAWFPNDKITKVRMNEPEGRRRRRTPDGDAGGAGLGREDG